MDTDGALIKGGYILVARKLHQSAMKNKPPLYKCLWFWMLDTANWKDRDKLMRGQLVTTVAEMQEAMSYYVGWRKITPTKDEIRSAYEAFVKAAMIKTAKTTRGMIITICNYDFYQNAKNYEDHNEARNESPTKPTVTPHNTEEGEERKKYNRTLAEYSAEFVSFWSAYPRKEKKDAAYRAWKKIKAPAATLDLILLALSWQAISDKWTKDNGQYIPHAATYLNGGCWKDEPPKPAEPEPDTPTAEDAELAAKRLKRLAELEQYRDE